MSEKIVWMDLEMTGLEPERDQILEIATIITDRQLELVAEGPELVLHQPESVLNDMEEVVRKLHTKSGLWGKVLESTTDLATAEAQTLDFIKEHTKPQRCYLAGNSIWQDRRFVRKYMPRIEEHLHYRMIDVSTLKMLADFWYPKVQFGKRNTHRALDDIRESIEELRYYRGELFSS